MIVSSTNGNSEVRFQDPKELGRISGRTAGTPTVCGTFYCAVFSIE